MRFLSASHRVFDLGTTHAYFSDLCQTTDRRGTLDSGRSEGKREEEGEETGADDHKGSNRRSYRRFCLCWKYNILCSMFLRQFICTLFSFPSCLPLILDHVSFLMGNTCVSLPALPLVRFTCVPLSSCFNSPFVWIRSL